MCTITCNQMLSCLVESKQLHFFTRRQPYFFHSSGEMRIFLRNGFFMQTNAISSNLVRSRKSLCETPN